MSDFAAVPATEGLWVDCDTIGSLAPHQLAALLAYTHPQHGKVVGVVGYSALPGEHPDGTLWTPATLAMVLEAGLQASWIQHPLAPGWLPSEHLAALHEATASEYAASCGFPVEMHGGVDIEGAGGPTYGYGLTWATNRVQRGGKCLGYYGYELGMTLAQFAAMPNVTSYWQAYNQARLPGRGPALAQGPTITIPGFGAVDIDVMARDARGELPMVCARLIAPTV